jgi:hypothetical protein
MKIVRGEAVRNNGQTGMTHLAAAIEVGFASA